MTGFLRVSMRNAGKQFTRWTALYTCRKLSTVGSWPRSISHGTNRRLRLPDGGRVNWIWQNTPMSGGGAEVL
jgi:hypothetical protein